MDEFLSTEVHAEFAQRMEDEHRRINRRLEGVESSVKEITRLTLSVQSLAESVQRMCKEQERQSERLQVLESRDGEKWREVVKYLITGVVGAVVGYIMTRLGALL